MEHPEKSWMGFADWITGEASAIEMGRPSLRRRWSNLRRLADQALARTDTSEIQVLLGKPISSLDPELNDLKALVAYAIGKGAIRDGGRLREAIELDNYTDPLAFLADQSGKSFGETWAPRIARYWLYEPSDVWQKKGVREFYDIGWGPHEHRGREIRIELKASSEHPQYRFQQIRHPRLSGGQVEDYDLLLCLGVTAGSLEWWAIPVEAFPRIAENGLVGSDRVVITKQHGKREIIWNDQVGYADEGWFVADERRRNLLSKFSIASDSLRHVILQTL